MKRKKVRIAVLVIVLLAVLAICASVWLGRSPTGVDERLVLPGTVLSEIQMQNIWGGKDNEDEEQKKPDCDSPKGTSGDCLHNLAAYGTVETDVPICTVKSADAPTIVLRFHYDSGKADGSIARRQTVLGYGWTHNYNTHLIVREREIFMPDADGRMTRFYKRFDGGYTVSPGYTHTLSRVDSNTFLLKDVEGQKLTFKLFEPAPWPTGGQLFQLTKIEDPQGRTITLSYNIQGLLETITDPYSRQISFVYNASKHIQTIIHVDGRMTQIEYQNADDDLWRITDPLGYTLEYSYDSQNRMTTEKLKDGNTWTCIYDGHGKPYQLIDGNGQVCFTFSNSVDWAIDNNRVLKFNEVRYIPGQTTVIDGCGNVTIYHYDENGHITKIENADGTNTAYEYNDDLRLVRKTDEEGNSWFYEYDGHRNRTKIIDPLGNVTQMFYEHPNIPSLLTKRIEPDGDVWEYEYNSLGNLIKEIDPIVETPTDKVITYTYTYYAGPPYGQLQTKTRTYRNGNVTRWDYGTGGTLASEKVDPCGLGITTLYEYVILILGS
jgi:YD repeat-containing protein